MRVNVIASPRNPVTSQTEAIGVHFPFLTKGQILTSALLASGFWRMNDSNEWVATLLPCALGTFSNTFTRGTDGCTKCPAGMLCSHPCSWFSSQIMNSWRGMLTVIYYTPILRPSMYNKAYDTGTRTLEDRAYVDFIKLNGQRYM